MKETKELGAKIGSPKEVWYTKVKEAMEAETDACKRTIEFNDKILPVVQEIIDKEKESFK